MRPLGPDEWATARALRIAAMTDAPDAFGSTLDRESALTEAQWRARIGDGGWYAAFRADHAVGLACCYVEDPRVPQLVAMWVAPDGRGSGAADLLVAAVLDHARALGATAVRLWVVETNARAAAVYARAGFATTGLRQPLPRDPSVEEVEMRVALSGVRSGVHEREERERRFLVRTVPDADTVTASRRICDRYLTDTRLRLRRIDEAAGGVEYKLTQKVPSARAAAGAGAGAGALQGTLTSIYLAAAEYEVLAALPAAGLSKTRHSVPPLGIDVFEGPLSGLILAEAEFGTDEDAESFAPPAWCLAEVTDDPRFTGGRLAAATRAELRAWLAEWDIAVP